MPCGVPCPVRRCFCPSSAGYAGLATGACASTATDAYADTDMTTGRDRDTDSATDEATGAGRGKARGVESFRQGTEARIA